jgi:competence protein ComEC
MAHDGKPKARAALVGLRPHWTGAGIALGGAARFQALWDEEAARRTGFLWLPVAFGLGILLYFSARSEPQIWAGPVLLVLASSLAIALRDRARAIFLAVCMVAVGFSAGSFRTAGVAAPMLERAGIYRVTGWVESVDAAPRRHRITLAVTAIEGLEPGRLPLRLRIGAPGPAEFVAGQGVSVRARLAPPSEAAMPGGYDFRRDALFKGIGGVGYTLGRIEAAEPAARTGYVFAFWAGVDRARNALTERISQAMGGGDAGALSAALITGKRGLISPEANDDLRASGLYHIVSISGLHMVLAAGVMFWVLRAGFALIPAFALRYPIKKWAAAGAMLGAIAYCLFSGSEVATERSLIMTLVMLGAILVDRPALAMRNVAISALIVLAREPESLLGPSFQMSYAAVMALIAGAEIWRRFRPAEALEGGGPRPATQTSLIQTWPMRAARHLGMAFLGILATTILASLATAPFSAFHFHRLNPYGLIGNALAIPLVSLVVMPCAVIGTLLVPFSLDHLVWVVMGEATRAVLWVAAWVGSFEGAAPPVPRSPPWLFFMLVVALLVAVLMQTALRWLALIPLLAWLVLLRTAPAPDLAIAPDGRMALIRTEAGYRLLSPASPSNFTLAQWLPALGDARRPTDPTLRAGIRCDRAGCTGRLADGRVVALVLTLEAARRDCTRADLVITPLAIPAETCGLKPLIDRGVNQSRGAIFAHWPFHEARPTLEGSLTPGAARPWRRPNPLGVEPSTAVEPAADRPMPGASSARGTPALPDDDPAIDPQ